MKNRQSRVKKGLMGLVGGLALTLGVAGLTGGCNTPQKPVSTNYSAASIVESEYEKLEKDILKKVRKIATIDPNDLEPGFFHEKYEIGEKGYMVHYEGKDQDGNEFDIGMERPEYDPKTLRMGVLFYNRKTNSSCGFESQLEETNEKNKVKIRIGNDHKFIDIKKKTKDSLTKISKTYVYEPFEFKEGEPFSVEKGEGLLISTDISIKEMQELIDLIKQFEAKYAPKDFKP